MSVRLFLLLSASFLLAACGRDAVAPPPAVAYGMSPAPPPIPLEERAQLIPLAGPIASRDAEISGLAWHGDDLVLLPQYPGRFSSQTDSVNSEEEGADVGALFVLSKADLIAFLDGARDGVLRPRSLRFEAPGLAGKVTGFDGYEAIAFRGNRVFVLIESTPADAVQGYLVEGVMEAGERIRLDAETVTPLPVQARRLSNLSYETLLDTPGGVVALQEANGAIVNPRAEAYRFGADLRLRDSLRVPTIEYRLTDATGLDAAGQFWAVNYFYPGDSVLLRPDLDSLKARFGAGPTHLREATVERLVEFRLDGARIVRTERPPIQLELLGAARSRNWEGIARLGDRGFLLATDKYPETMLAFIPISPDDLP